MNQFADVLPVVGRSFPITLTYAVPDELIGRLGIGSQVLIPLAGRAAAGYILALSDTPPQIEKILPIEALIDTPPAFGPRELKLARWIAGYHCCPLAQALRPFLSEVGAVRLRRALRLTEAGRAALDSPPADAKPEVQQALAVLREKPGAVTRRALAAAVGAKRLPAVLRALKAAGLIEETAKLATPAKEQYEELVSLAIDEEETLRQIEKLSPRAPKQASVLGYLLEKCLQAQAPCEVPLGEIARAAAAPQAVRALAKKGLARLRRVPRWRTPWAQAAVDRSPSPTLNLQQEAALQEILAALKARRHEVFLLFGVTGSGKTELFLRAIAQALADGQQALLLVPEISLTAQVVGLLRARFGDEVAVIHSALSAGERRDEKERIRLGRARVVVGPRSALFSPFNDLGVVVVDEEYDTSYKQEQDPRYHARDVALKLAQEFSCPCVLASATPSLESFYAADKGRYRLLRLHERPEGRPLPQVHLIDLKGASRRKKILMPDLEEALKKCLEAEGQAIIFLNRRGHSTFLFCPLCGHAFRCSHCQVALIYHAKPKWLRCHHCDYTMRAPTVCPNCMGSTLKMAGFGTQRVAQELEEIFPASRVSRMDRDTTTRKGSHLQLITDFRETDTDMMVGTQMVGKGLHFPGVTVVGVVAADVSLNTPDFRAAERTFQLLTQVAGRAGRGDEPGHVYIQTYHPDHYAIQAAAKHDFDAFYTEELQIRQDAGYPPFTFLANIIVAAAEAETAKSHCEALAAKVRAQDGADRLELLGPAPAPLAKLKDRYRFHFLLRTEEAGLLQQVLGAMQEDLAGRGRIHVTVDIDPVSMM